MKLEQPPSRRPYPSRQANWESEAGRNLLAGTENLQWRNQVSPGRSASERAATWIRNRIQWIQRGNGKSWHGKPAPGASSSREQKITWAIHCLGARFAEQKIMSDKDRQLDLAEKTSKSAPGSRRERDPEPKTGARRKTTLSSVNCRTESVEAEKLKPWRRNSSSCAEIGDWEEARPRKRIRKKNGEEHRQLQTKSRRRPARLEDWTWKTRKRYTNRRPAAADQEISKRTWAHKTSGSKNQRRNPDFTRQRHRRKFRKLKRRSAHSLRSKYGWKTKWKTQSRYENWIFPLKI
jgi:hypothetical protein